MPRSIKAQRRLHRGSAGAGTCNVLAVYRGDSNFGPAASSLMPLTVTGAVTADAAKLPVNTVQRH